MDVGAQRLQRRDVDDADLVGKRRAQTLLKQLVEAREKGRKRLSGSGRRRDERVAARMDLAPAACLRGRRLAERLGNQRATIG